MVVSTKSDTRLEVVSRKISVSGIRPIMFDRYPGDNDTKLAWHEKVYLMPGTNILCLPVINIASAYTSVNGESFPKVLRDKRKYKSICRSILSFVMFEGCEADSEYAPLMRNGAPIEVGTFGDALEPKSGLKLHRSVARLEKGIPNPKERALLPLPWSLDFSISILPNNAIKEAEIRNLTIEGGMAVGFGTYRGPYGKFQVDSWE